MENKYYTPEIEEFCSGFHFEYRSNRIDSENVRYKTDWKRTKFDVNFDLEMLRCLIKNGDVRVSYLMKFEIESLGFKEDVISSVFAKNDFRIVSTSKYYGDNQYQIYEYKGCNTYVRFAGTIKNKTEFKKLLKMLNIE